MIPNRVIIVYKEDLFCLSCSEINQNRPLKVGCHHFRFALRDSNNNKHTAILRRCYIKFLQILFIYLRIVITIKQYRISNHERKVSVIYSVKAFEWDIRAIGMIQNNIPFSIRETRYTVGKSDNFIFFYFNHTKTACIKYHILKPLYLSFPLSVQILN